MTGPHARAASHEADPAAGAGTAQGGRRAELAARLAAVRGRIAAACVAAGRSAEEVELLAVTKTRPASDLALLLDLGLLAFGENRPQEAGAKVAELAGLRAGAAPRWHLVGSLQRNKARAVAGWAARVESVDSARLADALDAAALRARDEGARPGPLPVLIQLSLDGDPARGGVPIPGLAELADRVAGTAGLALHGLMAVAPLGVDPDQAFDTLREAAAGLLRSHPDAREVSAGMTADFERAIRYGSTCVRVGTALLGDRPLASP
ncbi:MAG TPA: YggS family pyridoxal phosphate-dependent enzyme [Pseudonocardia sp.]|nr:YggS family pyridoxal phosphate-dependent enzyme [Pseudonocardia sp.]